MPFSYPFDRDCQMCEVDLGGVIVDVCQKGVTCTSTRVSPSPILALSWKKRGASLSRLSCLCARKASLGLAYSVRVIALSKRSEEIRCTVFGVASIVCLPFGSLVTCLRWKSVPTDVSSSTTASLTSTLGR